jgi:hypothetical protein
MEYEKLPNNEYGNQPEKNRQIFTNLNDNKNNILEVPNKKINIQTFQGPIIDKYTIIILMIFFILFFYYYTFIIITTIYQIYLHLQIKH